LFTFGLAVFGVGEGLFLLIAAYAMFCMSDAAISGADSAMLYDTLTPLGRKAEFEPKLGRRSRPDGRLRRDDGRRVVDGALDAVVNADPIQLTADDPEPVHRAQDARTTGRRRAIEPQSDRYGGRSARS